MKFTDMPLLDEIQQNLKREKYYEATPIQEKAIPPLLAGKDVMGIAQTGTGKTAAFGLPLLQQLMTHDEKVKPYHARALILAPTRELAAQIDKSLKVYGKGLGLNFACVFGGVGQRPQENAMAKGVDVLVATPGRLLDLHRQKFVVFKDIKYFVLDEADRMLDMGFLPDITEVLKHVDKVKQKLLFSATMRPEIEKLARGMLHDPVHIEIEPESTTAENVEQHVLYVDPNDKNPLLLHLLEKDELDHVLVFTRTKHRSDRLAKLLKRKGFKAEAIHGDKSQSARTRVLEQFRRKKINVLCATEIAARGLDVDDITHVINFDVPEDPESYVHRIGRTARAGAAGVAYLFCTAKEKSLVKNIEKSTGSKLSIMPHMYHSAKAQESRETYSRKGGGNRGSPKGFSRGRGNSRGQQKQSRDSPRQERKSDDRKFSGKARRKGDGRKPRSDSGDRKPRAERSEGGPKKFVKQKKSGGKFRKNDDDNTSRAKPKRAEQKRWGKNRRDEGKPPKPKKVYRRK